MLIKRAKNDRGRGKMDWLDSWHSFSFGGYYDPAYMGFHCLRVINEDIIHGGGGFGMHGHKDMEILTVMVSGRLAHTDSLGNRQELQPGAIQLMRAGRGIRHSEFNASATEPAHLLQIWIEPAVQGLEPGYQERQILDAEQKNQLVLLVSPDGQGNSLMIAQDARVYMSKLLPEQRIGYDIAANRAGWIQMIAGHAQVNGMPIEAVDGVMITEPEQLKFHGVGADDAHFLIFDLAMVSA